MSELEGLEDLPSELREFVISPESMQRILVLSRKLHALAEAAMELVPKPRPSNEQEAEQETQEEIIRDYVRETLWSIFESMTRQEKPIRISEVRTILLPSIEDTWSAVQEDVDLDAHRVGLMDGIGDVHATLPAAIVHEFLRLNPLVDAEITRDCATKREKNAVRQATFTEPLMRFLTGIDK